MTKRKAVTALGLFLALGMWKAGSAQAAATNPAYEDLLVTFSGNLSVKVDGIEYSSRTLPNSAAGVTVVPASSATVTNDGAFTEKWQLMASNVSLATPWTLVTSTGNTGGGAYCATQYGANGCPGLEQFALQALFISSAAAATCPINTSSSWDIFASTVGATNSTYLANQYADTNTSVAGASAQPDGTAGSANGNMNVLGGTGAGKRGLCVRLTMPGSVNTATNQQIIRLTITAINGG